jgi:copper homeostasis protein
VTEASSVPVFVLIRPRGGDFVYSDQELNAMRRDIDISLTLGVSGFATGVLRADSTINVRHTKALVKAAGNQPVTFHRAFDFTADRSTALEQLIDAGVQRVLTSGGAPTALEGADQIARLVDLAEQRIVVMAGGGIREGNIREVIARTRVREVHAGISSTTRSRSAPAKGVRLRKSFPDQELDWDELDEARLRQLVELSR